MGNRKGTCLTTIALPIPYFPLSYPGSKPWV